MKVKFTFKTIIKAVGLLLFTYFIFNSFRIYQFSKINSAKNADIALVLGAGTSNGIVSPVFKERINHSIKLYKQKRVQKILFTGGYGKGEKISDSQVAKNYAIENGIPEEDIFIEEQSQYTIQNLKEAKKIMNSIDLETALLVSDPIHMKRSISLAEKLNINCFSSPTQTSKYQSKKAKIKFLFYETLFFTGGEIIGKN